MSLEANQMSVAFWKPSEETFEEGEMSCVQFC